MKMKRSILDVLFPNVRASVFRLLFSTPQKQRYVRELANMSGLALCTIQDELRKLSAINLVVSRVDQRRHYYGANRNHPLFPQLVRIVQLSDRLPRTSHSALHRQRGSRRQVTRRHQKRATLPVDRPTNWHLFSHRPG